MSRQSIASACLLLLIINGRSHAQTGPTPEEEAVGQSINYVFATELGSGLYDLDGRSLQIYRYTYEHELRETKPDKMGVRFVLPFTAGFFDFSPLDVISEGPPTRVDSFSVVPGLEFDFLRKDDLHLIPYVRAGFSVASSSVDGWLYGAGIRLEKRSDFRGWDRFVRSDLAYAAVNYRNETPNDRFVRWRQAIDLTRTSGKGWRGKQFEFGIYGVFDMIFDPPTAPLAGAKEEPLQAELGITFSSRPRIKIWRFDAPKLGFGYRFAGDLSAWRLVIGAPF